MGHGIGKFDKGYLAGSEAWHHHPNYIITGKEPVTIEQAQEVAAVPVLKVPLYMLTKCLETEPQDTLNEHGAGLTPIEDINEIQSVEGAYALVRPDHNIVLAPMVGRAYHPTEHGTILQWVNEILLQVYPELAIMGCGTMNNGAQFFIQIQAKEFFVAGDESSNNLKLLYGQHYGVSPHITAACVERVVCQNTWQIAVNEATLNNRIKQHKHTRNAAVAVTEYLDMMANILLGLDKHILLLEGFTKLAVDSEFMVEFLDKFYPLPKESDGRAYTIAINHRVAIQEVFESQDLEEELKPFARKTRYALWQAFTGHVDHDGNIKNGDDSLKDWDCRLGLRAKLKAQGFKWLCKPQNDIIEIKETKIE